MHAVGKSTLASVSKWNSGKVNYTAGKVAKANIRRIIHYYAKMADQGRSDFYAVFTMSLSALGLRQLLISLLFQIIQALILCVHALRSYLKLICEYELHSLPNKKVSGEKDHDENYIKVRPPLVSHLLRNRLL